MAQKSMKQWQSIIRKNCKAIGTYQKCFDPIIDTLSDILQRRDSAVSDYEKSGGHCIVKHTNKAGQANLEQNPILRLINDLNRDALMYWRELGLTPASLKKINEDAIAPEKPLTALEKFLMEHDQMKESQNCDGK